jgi:hypothetical protein
MRPTSEDTTSPLKHPVQRPTKTADQHEKEYIDNVFALKNLDEADWIEAVTLLESAQPQNKTYQAV